MKPGIFLLFCSRVSVRSGDAGRERSVSAQLVCPALCFLLQTEQMQIFHIDHFITGADCHVCKYAVSRDLFSGERAVIDLIHTAGRAAGLKNDQVRLLPFSDFQCLFRAFPEGTVHVCAVPVDSFAVHKFHRDPRKERCSRNRLMTSSWFKCSSR